jgi:hypothetical protein
VLRLDFVSASPRLVIEIDKNESLTEVDPFHTVAIERATGSKKTENDGTRSAPSYLP